ncbi:hypothetical protein BDW66DRAFT_128456 [Aspergillus desertorum]
MSRRSISRSSLGKTYEPSWYLWYVLPFSIGYSVTLAVKDWVSYSRLGSERLPVPAVVLVDLGIWLPHLWAVNQLLRCGVSGNGSCMSMGPRYQLGYFCQRDVEQ